MSSRLERTARAVAALLAVSAIAGPLGCRVRVPAASPPTPPPPLAPPRASGPVAPAARTDPPVDWEARREAELARDPQPGFTNGPELSEHEAETFTRSNLWFPIGAAVEADLAALGAGRDVDVPSAGDVAVLLHVDGSLSALAGRAGLTVTVGEASGRLSPLGRGGYVLLRAEPGPAALSVAVHGFEASPYATELGDGRVRVHLFVRPRREAFTAEQLQAVIEDYTAGHRSVGIVGSGRLEHPEPVEVRVRRGDCLLAVLRTGPGGRPEPPLGNLALPDLVIHAGPGVLGSGGVFAFGCPLVEGRGAITLAPAGRPAGEGPYTIELFRRRASEAEMAELEREDREDREATERGSAEMRRGACSRCAAEHRRCLDAGGPCADEYAACIRSRGYSEDDC